MAPQVLVLSCRRDACQTLDLDGVTGTGSNHAISYSEVISADCHKLLNNDIFLTETDLLRLNLMTLL